MINVESLISEMIEDIKGFDEKGRKSKKDILEAYNAKIKEGGFDFGGYIFKIGNVDIKEDDPLEKIGLGIYFVDNVEREKRKIKAKKIISDILAHSILTSKEILEALKAGEIESKKIIPSESKLKTSATNIDVVEK